MILARKAGTGSQHFKLKKGYLLTHISVPNRTFQPIFSNADSEIWKVGCPIPNVLGIAYVVIRYHINTL